MHLDSMLNGQELMWFNFRQGGWNALIEWMYEGFLKFIGEKFEHFTFVRGNFYMLQLLVYAIHATY